MEATGPKGYYSQSSQTQDHRDGYLGSPLHLHIPQQDARQDSQRPVRDDGHGREVEADTAVELIAARAVSRLAPERGDGVAQVGDGHNEDDGGRDRRADDGPQRPDEAAARVGDAEQTHADAGFDGHGAGGVEELGDEEELFAGWIGFWSQQTLYMSIFFVSPQGDHYLVRLP